MEATAVPNSSASCLCLGPKQSGKTHLLSSLQNAGSITNVSHSVPTIGTNIFTIRLPETAPKKGNTSAPTTTTADTEANKKSGASGSIRRSTKKPTITITEIGGSMAPMWSNYLNNVSKIVYVIDTSNLCQISAAGNIGRDLVSSWKVCFLDQFRSLFQVSFCTHYWPIRGCSTPNSCSSCRKWTWLIDKCEMKHCSCFSMINWKNKYVKQSKLLKQVPLHAMAMLKFSIG